MRSLPSAWALAASRNGRAATAAAMRSGFMCFLSWSERDVVLGQADDAGGEMLAHKKRAPARFGVHAHHRVDHGLDFVDLGLGQVRAPRAALLQLGILFQVAVLGAQA